MSDHLRDHDHPYYGPEGGSYWATGMQCDEYNPQHESWGNFLNEWESPGPEDLNVLIRWDWRDKECSPFEDYEGDTLFLHYVLPRKSIFLTHTIKVTDADEPAVREWLRPRAEYMRTLWEPLLDRERGAQ